MERDWLFAAAVARRHDGPLPPAVAVPADYGAPWAEQLENRRRLAWRDVRRIGHRLARAGRARDYPQWRRLRHELAFALRSWQAYRDWGRSADNSEPDPARSRSHASSLTHGPPPNLPP